MDDVICPLADGGGLAEDTLGFFLVPKLCVDVVVCVFIVAGNALTISALLHQRWCRKETLCPRFKVGVTHAE